VIDPRDLHEGDYTPWGGREVYGWPSCTIIGGRVVIAGSELVDDGMYGQLLRRTLDPAVALGTAVG
jgi:hypothetical protein